MKKIVILIVVCLSVSLCLTGCKSSQNKIDIGNESGINISKTDVTMSIKKGTLTNKGATIVLTNESDKDYEYGSPYEIEVKKNGKWHKINAELDFDLPAFILKAGEKVELELDWENGYGSLPKGTYRIIKDMDYEYENEKYNSFNIAVEFNID